jgi:hypothetical protein
MLLVERKTRGAEFDEAESQAHRCVYNLLSAGRSEEVPRYVIATDFARISLLDLEPDDPKKRAILGGYRIEFPLAQLHRHIHDFAFIPGHQQHHLENQPTSQGA